MATANVTVTDDDGATEADDRLKNPPAADPRDGDGDIEAIRAENKRIKDALAKANNEAKQSRLRLQAIDEAERQKKEAELGEAEKATKRAEDAERKVRELETARVQTEAALRRKDLEISIEREARNQDWEDSVELAVKLIDFDSLDINEDTGEVKGIKDAIERLGKKYPGLVGGNPNAFRPNGGTPPGRESARRQYDGERPANGRREDPYRADLEALGRGGRM